MFHFDLTPVVSMFFASVVGFVALVACTVAGVWWVLPAWAPLAAFTGSGFATFVASQVWLSR